MLTNGDFPEDVDAAYVHVFKHSDDAAVIFTAANSKSESVPISVACALDRNGIYLLADPQEGPLKIDAQPTDNPYDNFDKELIYLREGSSYVFNFEIEHNTMIAQPLFVWLGE